MSEEMVVQVGQIFRGVNTIGEVFLVESYILGEGCGI